jgi:hypothetical protein
MKFWRYNEQRTKQILTSKKGNTYRVDSVKDEDKKTSVIHVRCTAHEKAKFVKAAYKNKLTKWVVKTLHKAADEELQ